MKKWDTKSLARAIEKFTEGQEIQKPRDYEAEAKWFVAYHVTQSLYDCYTIKDWAHHWLDGIQPQTDQDISDFLNDEDEGPMPRQELMVMIRNFYGITQE